MRDGSSMERSRQGGVGRMLCVLLVGLAALVTGCPDGSGGPTLDASGGDASAESGRGAAGGEIDIRITLGDDAEGGVEIRRSGSADTSYESPPLLPPFAGSNPLVVTDEVIVEVVNEGDPPAGTVYIEDDETSLFISNGDNIEGNEPPITGLDIRRGGVLVLPHDSEVPENFVRLEFTNDIINDGLITTDDPAGQRDRGHVRLVSTDGSYVGSGDIDLSGTSNASRGGIIAIVATRVIFNEGEMRASGGAADHAGTVEFVDVDAGIEGAGRLRIENRGRIDVRGGDASSGGEDGGVGGSIVMLSSTDLFNAGDLLASGGRGSGQGGPGGQIELVTARFGDIVNEGDLVVDGARGDLGRGGAGREIRIVATGGGIRSSGDLLLRGGASRSDAAGAGGEIDIITLDENATVFVPGLHEPAGSIELSGRILATGGSGSSGSGMGGIIAIANESVVPDLEDGRRIVLLGHRRVSATGGNGALGGGTGGELHVETAQTLDLESPVSIEPRVDLSGGDSDAFHLGGAGGDATLIGLSVDVAEIDVSGGDGGTPGSEGDITIVFP